MLIVLTASITNAAHAADDGIYKETRWEALIPKDWDPASQFKSLRLST